MKKQNETLFWSMMLTVFLGSFIVMLSSSTINIALPYLMKTFNTDLDTAKWSVTGFMLTMGISAPMAAFLGEKISYKRLYLASIIGFTLVSLIAALSSNIYMLIVIRVLQGLFGGVTVPATMSIIYQVIPKEKQVTAISIWSIAPTLAPAVGPTISGYLIQYFGWKAIFIINIPIGFIAVIMGIIYMPYYKLNTSKTLDGLGIISSILTSTTLLFAFSEGSTWGWNSPAIVVLLIIGVLSLAFFIWWELHTKEPFLNLQIFKYPKFVLGVVIGGIINVALYSGTFMTPIFLQNIQGMAPLDSALVLLPASILMAILMPIVGKLYKQIGSRPLIVTGVLLVSFGTWRMSSLSVNTDHSYIRTWMAFRYIGLALATMPAAYAGMATLPKEVSGHGSSINNWTKQILASLAIGIFTSILATRVAFHCSFLYSLNQSTNIKYIKATGYVMGINDIYSISFLIILAALPFAFFLKKATPTKSPISES